MNSAWILSGAMVIAAWTVGGWPWGLTLACALVLANSSEPSWRTVLWVPAVSLIFLAFFLLTGDRRFFFPFSIQLAVQCACLMRRRSQWAAWSAGAAMVGVFTLIRIVQAATVPVLTVELIVAGVALAVGIAVGGRQAEPLQRRTAASSVAALIALVGLLL